MGFLDGLFGGDKPQKVRLSGLGSWLEQEIKSESEDVVDEAEPVLESINGLVVKLRRDVVVLGEAGFNDIDPRYDKIVRTAKPAYVKSMLLAVDGLEFGGSGLSDIRSYVARLSQALDTVGRVSFGDGKFLPYAFQSQMKDLQGDCRKLLNGKEKLDAILNSNGSIAKLTDLQGKNSLYLGLLEKKGKVLEDAKKAALDAESGRKRLAALHSELEALRKSPDYRGMEDARRQLALCESEAKHIGSKVHSALSPLKSGLRKFEKAVFDKGMGKLALAVQEDPVEAYFAAGELDIDALIDAFESACKKGSITLKDQDKTLKKVDSARAQLSGDLRPEFFRLNAEAERLRRTLQGMPVVAEEDRIRNELASVELSAGKSDSDSAEAKERAGQLQEEADRLLAELGDGISGVGVELDVGP